LLIIFFFIGGYMFLNKNDSAENQLLTRKEAAHYLGVTESTLAVWACTKRYNLTYVKVGRLVKYRRADLDAFISRRTIM
jgi:excisionase family DNA binding protein